MLKKIIFLLMLTFIFLNFCKAEEAKMKKILLIIAHRGFRDEELLKPKKIFEENGFKTVIASTSLKTAEGMLGTRIKPDILINDINVNDYEAVVFVGGMGASCYWNDPLAHTIAQDFYNKGKIVSAICIAPVILANAGLLKDKKATVWESEAGQLKNKGAQYTGRPVEKDGKIITASGPFAAEEFGRAILEELLK
jgi:protease I